MKVIKKDGTELHLEVTIDERKQSHLAAAQAELPFTDPAACAARDAEKAKIDKRKGEADNDAQ